MKNKDDKDYSSSKSFQINEYSNNAQTPVRIADPTKKLFKRKILILN